MSTETTQSRKPRKPPLAVKKTRAKTGRPGGRPRTVDPESIATNPQYRLRGPQPPPHVDPLVKLLWDETGRKNGKYIITAPGVTARTIQLWFQGKRSPTVEAMRVAFLALGMELDAYTIDYIR